MVTAERTTREQALRRALVVDESPLRRHGMAAVLAERGIAVAAQVATCEEALATLPFTVVDLLVVVVPSNGTAAELVRRAGAQEARLRTIVLVPRLAPDQLRSLLATGPDAVLTHHAGVAEIIDAVDQVAAGERVVAPAHLGTLFGSLSAARQVASPLTQREMVVLDHLAHGRSNREIADAMVVSVATVKTHLSHIYEKLRVAGRRDAVGRGIELGLLV